MITATKIKKKYCPGCEHDRPVGEFNKDRFTKSGLACYCRECKHRQGREYYAQFKDTVRRRHQKYIKEYRSTIRGYLGQVFNDMNQRCNNPKYKEYRNYGGRGIQNKFKSIDGFRDYVIDELGIASIDQIRGLQIDRIDNDGHYEPGNIRFVTSKVNSNNKRNSKKVMVV